MKNYLRTVSASCLLMLGLSAGTAAAYQTATDTSTAAKKHAKSTGTSTAAKKAAFTPTANASAADIAAAKSSGQVWVNTSSKAYHKSTSKYYGATKAGKFMSEADAQKAGYHLAKD
jgi:hypothetical protein